MISNRVVFSHLHFNWLYKTPIWRNKKEKLSHSCKFKVKSSKSKQFKEIDKWEVYCCIFLLWIYLESKNWNENYFTMVLLIEVWFKPADHLVERGYRMECPKGCNTVLYGMMSNCWDIDPKERPNFKEICELLTYFYYG